MLYGSLGRYYYQKFRITWKIFSSVWLGWINDFSYRPNTLIGATSSALTNWFDECRSFLPGFPILRLKELPDDSVFLYFCLIKQKFMLWILYYQTKFCMIIQKNTLVWEGHNSSSPAFLRARIHANRWHFVHLNIFFSL